MGRFRQRPASRRQGRQDFRADDAAESNGGHEATARITTALLGPDGAEIGRSETSVDLAASGSQEIKQEIALTNPPLWSPETPQLSTAVTDVIVDGKTVDEVTTQFGVRALAWSAEKGLTLNGKTYKLSGGCIHDDNGVLGACAFDRAEERKIELLKAAGFNAIRTAHNPPSPALLDACDRLGMLVMDEAFDCWANGKNTNDYTCFQGLVAARHRLDGRAGPQPSGRRVVEHRQRNSRRVFRHGR